jgi:1,4-alpha-glucan branching enzyme
MPALGAFTFVLHSHFPYCRLAGRWPHGEEWIHEASAETYVPLLNALYDLRERGVRLRLTISLSPVLAEQLNDADIRANFTTYLREKIAAAQADEQRHVQSGEGPRLGLAKYYREWYEHILGTFEERFAGDLIGAFRRLQDEGLIEIITCGATHGYLPLLSRDESISLQVKTAVASYRRLFGRDPRAIWLPECAYRPGYRAESGVARPGLEEFLMRSGLRAFFSDTHTVVGGELSGPAAGEAIGPYGQVTRRYTVPMLAGESPMPATSFQPYFVGQSTVAVIARNRQTGLQVWSGEWGYPGEAAYREFHKKDDHSGLQYWRVTGPHVDLGAKDLYDPAVAQDRMRSHADHFAALIERELASYAEASGRFGLLAANYDTELFGHWWFEGVDWLREVLARVAANPRVELTTASEFLTAHPPREALNLPESSWGAGGQHFVWDNPDTHWMWAPIHQAEARMARLVTRFSKPGQLERTLLNQIARELLLLQSSDWPFLVTTGQAAEYALQRFRSHCDRFNMLAASMENMAPDAALAEELWQKDRIFEDIDFRWFGP